MGARKLSYNSLYRIRSYNESSNGGNSYTTQFRQYDPRLGRWKSLDPLAGKFPNQSPFCAFNNNPIYFVDPLGLEGEGPGDGDKKKKGNGFWKKRDKNGDLTNEDADTRQLPDVTVNVPLPDKEKEEINARRRIKGIPSIQFENKLTKAQQKILLDRFNRMAARSGVWSKGTKELYDAIYYGRESYDKYFTAYNPTFGASFANNFSAGYLSWQDGSIGKDWSKFAAYSIGGTMTVTFGSFFLLDATPSGGGAVAFESFSASMFDAGTFVYTTGEYITSSTINYASQYLVGRLIIYGGSLYTGTNIMAYRTGNPVFKMGGISQNYKKVIPSMRNTVFSAGGNNYYTGFYIGTYRFQIHQHRIEGSIVIPHINYGFNGKRHIFIK